MSWLKVVGREGAWPPSSGLPASFTLCLWGSGSTLGPGRESSCFGWTVGPQALPPLFGGMGSMTKQKRDRIEGQAGRSRQVSNFSKKMDLFG